MSSRGIPITPEMVAGWAGPDGYTDINPNNHHCFVYRGGWAFIVFDDDGEVVYFAKTAWNDGSSTGPRQYCPEFIEIPPEIAARFQRHGPMPDPEFSLMAQAEELVEGYLQRD